MLDLKFIRNNPEVVKTAIRNKMESADVDALLKLDTDRRILISEVESLKKERNASSKKIAELKRKSKDASGILNRMKEVSDRISDVDDNLRKIESELNRRLLTIPNIPHPDVPVGKTEDDKKLLNNYGNKPQFDFKPRTHWEIGEILDIIDLARGASVSGSGFPV